MSFVRTLSNVHTPAVIKRSRSASFDTTDSSTKIKSQKINKNLFIEDERDISNISFEKFSHYCINNNISEDITDEITLCSARVTNLLKFDEFKNLNFDSKKAILIASISLICKNNKITEFFDLNTNQQEIITDILNIKKTNELWKFIPRDMFYLSQVGYNAIIKFTNKFKYNYNIKNEMIKYFNNINQNNVVNSILKNQYDSLMQDNIRLNTFLRSKKEIFNLDIINFFM